MCILRIFDIFSFGADHFTFQLSTYDILVLDQHQIANESVCDRHKTVRECAMPAQSCNIAYQISVCLYYSSWALKIAVQHESELTIRRP